MSQPQNPHNHEHLHGQEGQPARPADNLPNPTANAGPTDPGPAPASAGAGGGRLRAQTTPLPALSPEIPWNPEGKLDDLVERRTAGPAAPASAPAAGSSAPVAQGTLGSPKGGGTSAAAADAGPGRYGGAAEPPSANRYAGASDDAPTSASAGATTTLASLTAEGSGHEMRQGAPAGAADSETWQGGAATQEAMHGSPELADTSAAPAESAGGPAPAGTPAATYPVKPHGDGGGYSEVH